MCDRERNASPHVKLTICSQSLEQVRRGSLRSALINKIVHFCVLNRRVQATCGRVCTVGMCKPALRATEVNNLRTGKCMQTLEPIWPGPLRGSLCVRPVIFSSAENSTLPLFTLSITKQIYFSRVCYFPVSPLKTRVPLSPLCCWLPSLVKGENTSWLLR